MKEIRRKKVLSLAGETVVSASRVGGGGYLISGLASVLGRLVNLVPLGRVLGSETKIGIHLEVGGGSGRRSGA